jgi:hypothetical protein
MLQDEPCEVLCGIGCMLGAEQMVAIKLQWVLALRFGTAHAEFGILVPGTAGACVARMSSAQSRGQLLLAVCQHIPLPVAVCQQLLAKLLRLPPQA